MKIKVCGITRLKDLNALDSIGVDFVGTIRYPGSARYCASVDAFKTKRRFSKVAVFVNESPKAVIDFCKQIGATYAQLHGNETPAVCEEINKHVHVIKAFHVDGTLPPVSAYEGVASLFLFDTKSTSYGGSGRKFDWNLLMSYSGKTKFLLSGGLVPGDSAELNRLKKVLPMMLGVDLNSGFEIAPGIKQIELIKQFKTNLNESR